MYQWNIYFSSCLVFLFVPTESAGITTFNLLWLYYFALVFTHFVASAGFSMNKSTIIVVFACICFWNLCGICILSPAPSHSHSLSYLQMANVRVPIPANRPNGTATSGTLSSTSVVSCWILLMRNFLYLYDAYLIFSHSFNGFLLMLYSQTQTVVVENPMSVDESGKLVRF